MPLAIASTGTRPGLTFRSATPMPPLERLRRMLEQRRERRLDRAIALSLAELDHPGLLDDYRAARGRH